MVSSRGMFGLGWVVGLLMGWWCWWWCIVSVCVWGGVLVGCGLHMGSFVGGANGRWYLTGLCLGRLLLLGLGSAGCGGVSLSFSSAVFFAFRVSWNRAGGSEDIDVSEIEEGRFHVWC